MELKEYIRLAWHWAWLLALGVILAMVAAYLFTSYQSPVYQASSRVQVMSAPQSGGSDYSYWNDQQLARTYVQTIKSRLVIEEVESRLGVAVGSIRTQVVSDTQLIDIFVEDNDPQQAANIANMVYTVFAEQNEALQSSRYASSEASLKAQITQVEDQINSLQGEIDQLATESVQTQTTQVEAEITKLKTEIAQIESEIQGTGSGGSSVPNSFTTEREARLSQLKSMLSLYQEIYTNLVVAGKPSEAGTVDRLSRLQKTLDLYQQIYLQLLSSLEDIRLARLQNSSNIVQIEAARAPSSPIRPNLLMNLGLGAAVGLMLAAGVVFVIEYMNDTLKSSVDVNTMLGLPIIGYIAELKKVPAGEIYVSSNPRSPVAEAFRSLRANLEFADKETPTKTILVTSSRPGEGKTTIASNLAAIFAQQGKKVILVDADLRRPNVHGMTGVQNRMGLSTLFKAQLSIENVWRKRTGSDNLYVITSGSPLENPAELLSSEKMMLIMAELRKAADIVVIDSPPSVVADAQILASLVDGVILVVQPGKSPVDEAQATLTQMNTAGARMLGVVFNRIPRNRSHYYGGYRYYNHKGYYDDSLEHQKSQSVNKTGGAPQVDSMLPAPTLVVPDRSNGKSKPVVEPSKNK